VGEQGADVGDVPDLDRRLGVEADRGGSRAIEAQGGERHVISSV
jgi:hypothetical protein